MFHVPNKYRIKDGKYGSTDDIGNMGAFIIPHQSYEFTVIASDGAGWEHVSISLRNRCPNWNEMCYFKSMFWDMEDCVIQFHPPESEYVDNDKHCLHLWREINGHQSMPPSILVGHKNEKSTN